MADSTAFDPNEIKDAAKKIGEIVNDMAVFDDLKEHWPNAGHFEAAQWMERLVDDRRNGVVAHAERLQRAFMAMEIDLTMIANDFDNLDGENAAKVKTKVDGLLDGIVSDVEALDKTTEDDQHNFSEDPDIKAEDNAGDGDGYNDVLPV